MNLKVKTKDGQFHEVWQYNKSINTIEEVRVVGNIHWLIIGIDCEWYEESLTYNCDIIAFGMFLSGHDKETVEQIYKDWIKPKF